MKRLMVFVGLFDCGNWVSKSEMCRSGYQEGQGGNSQARAVAAVYKRSISFSSGRTQFLF